VVGESSMVFAERRRDRSCGVRSMADIFFAVVAGKSSSWYLSVAARDGCARNKRKKRVSVPAPRDMICLGCSRCAARNWSTRRSMAVVRTYVPSHIR